MSNCILVNTSEAKNGYGQVLFRGKITRAHRAAWIEANGEIPKGLVIDHTCHNPKECEGGITCPHRACVNVEHMRLVTQRENIMAGRHNIDNRSHCNQGHPFIKENIMIRKNGHRECAECNRVRARAAYQRKKVTA